MNLMFFKTVRLYFSGLVVRRGKPEVVIADLVKTLGTDTISAVAFQEEVSLVVCLNKTSSV